MASNIIPKEELTAYQRWELGGFDEPSLRDKTKSITEGPDAEAAASDAPVRLPTAEEIEQIHQQAWQEGYKLGLEEGRREGERYSVQLKALFSGMETASLAQDEALARELLRFALAVAHQIVGATFEAKPELMLDTVKEALAQLPHLNGHPRVAAHPANVQLLRDWLAQEHPHQNWHVVEDPRLSPGGFRVESSQGELDADLTVRWKEILLTLGGDPAWLE